jgi:hypothetical protein
MVVGGGIGTSGGPHTGPQPTLHGGAHPFRLHFFLLHLFFFSHGLSHGLSQGDPHGPQGGAHGPQGGHAGGTHTGTTEEV